MRPLRDAALAVTLLTAVPVPVRWPSSTADRGEGPDVAGWFAAVGLGLGGLLGGLLWLSWRYFYGVSGVLAALTLVALALVTRFMHWDGLADVADAWFAAEERRHDIMHDSHAGAFGATAIALVALVQWSALTELGSGRGSVALVVLAPVFGRLAATCAAWLGAPARLSGLGASVMRRPTPLGVAVTLASVAGAIGVASLLGAQPLPIAVVSGLGIVCALGVPHVMASRFGGVNGDVMGASVLVVESAVLVSALGVLGVMRLAGVAA